MQLQIRSTIENFVNGPGKQRMNEVLDQALRRFRNRIRSVQVFVEDLNGPRGGLDKECRCVVHLKRQPPVVIRDVDDCITTLAYRVANRASHAVSKVVGRRSKQGLRNRQRISEYSTPETG